MKSKMFQIAIQGLVLLGFNIGFFSALEDFSRSRWISYAAVHLSYFLFMASTYTAFNTKGGFVFGLPKMAYAYLLYLTVWLSSILFIWINPETIGFQIFWYVILTSFFLGPYLTLMLAEDHTRQIETANKISYQFVQETSTMLKMKLATISNRERYKKVESVLDAVMNAQVKVPEGLDVSGLEQSIKQAISQLSVEAPDLEMNLNRIKELLLTRNLQISNAN